MEAPFRFPISGLSDVERLLDALATSPYLVSRTLRLAEGQELLIEQLVSEGCTEALVPALKSGDFRGLMRDLWQQPLQSQHPRFLRFNANLVVDPAVEFSMRIDVPTDGNWPRWVDLEGSRDPIVLAHLRAVYHAIGHDTQLTLLEV